MFFQLSSSSWWQTQGLWKIGSILARFFAGNIGQKRAVCFPCNLTSCHICWSVYGYGSIPINHHFLGGWTSIYQLFWCETTGVQGFDTLPYHEAYAHFAWIPFWRYIICNDMQWKFNQSTIIKLHIWLVVWNIFDFPQWLGWWSSQGCWNHQPVYYILLCNHIIFT